MDFADEVLHISLKQDLRVLNEVVNNVLLKINKNQDINSWLFPTKPYAFVNEFIADNNIYEHGSEKLFLELIIDRLYFGISLILKHLEEKGKRCRNKFLLKPKQLTLGCCFGNFWEHIWKFIEEMEDNQTTGIDKKPSMNVFKIHRNTQTDIISLNRCDSCASAMLCMKNLLKMFENNSTEGHRKLRPQIYDITQFGCMLQATESINKSFRRLMDKLCSRESQIQKLQEEKETLDKSISDCNRKISLITEEVKLHKEKNMQSCSTISLLTDEKDRLLEIHTKCGLSIKSLEEIVTHLNHSLTKHKRHIDKLENSQKNMHGHIEHLSITQKEVLHKFASAQQNLVNFFANIQTTDDGIIKLQDTIEVINKRIGKVAKIQCNSETRIKNIISNFGEESLQITKTVVDFKNKVKDKVEQIFQSNKEPVQAVNNAPNFQIKGNPIDDLTGQIRENEKKIKELQKENEKLNLLLSRFKYIKK